MSEYKDGRGDYYLAAGLRAHDETDRTKRIAALLATDPEAFDWITAEGYGLGYGAGFSAGLGVPRPLPSPETTPAGGTTTDCPLEGVHEHPFRGPHRFHEWDPANFHPVGLPPGPYRVEWPAEQGGAFTLWGRQGTPPDFKDGWAIPLVASGVDTAMYALCDMLNAASPETTPAGDGDRPRLDPATIAKDSAYMAGLIRGRELERETTPADVRLAALREFLEDEGNYAGGVWGDYGQVVVDASMVWDIIDDRPHKWEMHSQYTATLNQAKEALEACEARETTALDVERLRKAIDLSGIGIAEGGTLASDWAETIAEEYVRLAAALGRSGSGGGRG